MTKTPFEIRFDLLVLAKDHLIQKYYANMEECEKTNKPIPSFPTDEEIFALAELYKNFVDSK